MWRKGKTTETNKTGNVLVELQISMILFIVMA